MMKIAESSVALAGEHRLEESRESSDSMKVFVSGGWKGFGEVFDDRVRNDKDAAPTEAPAKIRVRSGQGKEAESLILQLLLAILDIIKKEKGGSEADGLFAHCPRQNSRSVQTVQDVEPLQVEVTTRHAERVSEQECTAFSACGKVVSADGREMNFNLDLHMSRHYEHEETTETGRRSYQLKDPLVINFSGSAASLADTRFDFDLEGNGTLEAIPYLASGSGFLALDKNGDGKVSDGKELFGAISGNGFADLAAYDSNHDGWIDDSDPVFGHLLVWGWDKAGQESLESAKGAGVGALYLGSAATPFSLKDSEKGLQGQIRASGIYLAEDGSVGSLQQVDVAV
ncbi:MAG: hypothetical protein AB7U30_11700 [Sulfuricellaceae bacterium]